MYSGISNVVLVVCDEGMMAYQPAAKTKQKTALNSEPGNKLLYPLCQLESMCS